MFFKNSSGLFQLDFDPSTGASHSQISLTVTGNDINAQEYEKCKTDLQRAVISVVQHELKHLSTTIEQPPEMPFEHLQRYYVGVGVIHSDFQSSFAILVDNVKGDFALQQLTSNAWNK